MSWFEQGFPNLAQYLGNTNAAAAFQFLLFALIVSLLAERTLRAFGVVGQLQTGEPVTNRLIEELTRLCFALGLLLTFSGLYAYLGSSDRGNQWSLLLALGSSAIGYSAWTACAVGGVIDSCRGISELDRSTKANVAVERVQVSNESNRDCQPNHRWRTASDDESAPANTWPAGGNHSKDTDAEIAIRDNFGALADMDGNISSDDTELTDEAILEIIESDTNHEQELATDSGGGGRYLGGPIHYAASPADPALGSLHRYQRSNETAGGFRFRDRCG